MPSKFANVNELCVAFPQNAWNFLHSSFGGGPACCRLYECSYCKEELDTLNHQKEYELESFKQLHAQFQESAPDSNNVMYCLSSSWFKQWEQFVLGRQRDPPSHIGKKHALKKDDQFTLNTFHEIFITKIMNKLIY